MRRAAIAVLSAAVGVAAVIGAIAFFASRDEGSTDRRSTVGERDRGAQTALLRAGNVELTYGSAADRTRLNALVDAVGTGDSRALRAAGQAVVLRLKPGVSGVLARAGHHRLRVRSAADPRLQDFVETWLGAPTSP
jgi:hypothetical protein